MITSIFTFFAAVPANCKHQFFGLVPWYQYLNVNSNCDITNFTIFPSNAGHSDVPLVLVAIVDDLLRVAGIVAVAYVIVGAIKLITSQGNPEDMSRAQGTVINALIGLAIAIVAVGFVSFLGSKLGG